MNSLRCRMSKENISTSRIKPRFMRARQAAEYLSTSESTIWRLVQRGELPAPLKDGSRFSFFETAWLDEYADKLASMREGSA